MRHQVEHIQFPKKTWQAVTEHALRELSFRESEESASRIENLRPYHFEEETESKYGRQIWCFESMTCQSPSDRRIECGVLEFSIESGLLELIDCHWFSSGSQRDQWIGQRLDPPAEVASSCMLTKVWVYLAILGVMFLAIGWTISLLRFLNVAI
ncbi:MAG: hypothetical protein ACK5EO_15110 [Planctomycetota bacterium]